MDRSKKIIKASLVGIAVNVVLVLVKMGLGAITGSIAIVLDAINNLSDALSSIITILATKFAGKRPDRKHPYGYGRIEYMSAVLIAAIILTAGLTSLKESVEKTIHPEAAAYTTISLIILVIGVAAKFLFGRYVKKVGEEIHSDSLIASGSEALFDAVLSVATIVAAIVSILFHVSLEGILGVVISVLIIKAGVELLLETLSSIIGSRADQDLTKELKQKIATYPGVHGAYDLILHNYGPTQLIGSVHVEVDDELSAKEIHLVSRRIMTDLFQEYGITMTVGIYAANNTDQEFTEIRNAIRGLVNAHTEILQMHGFYGDKERMQIMFDLVVDFKADPEKVRELLKEEVEKKYPEYHFDVAFDTSFSD